MSTAALMLTNLDMIFLTLTVPTGHRLRDRWDLLRMIKRHIDLQPSPKILELLEDLAAMDMKINRQPSKSMKDAYLHLAVQITRDIVRSPDLDPFTAVGRISAVWDRLKRVDAATGDMALGSDKLRSWLNTKINEVMLAVLSDDAALRARVDSYFEGIEVVARESLIFCVYEQICEIRFEVPYVGQNPQGTGTDAGACRSSGIKRPSHASCDNQRSTPRENSTNPKRRRPYERWSLREEEALRRGVKEFGLGNWNAILIKYKQVFKSSRRNVDLKDKWSQMVRKNATSPIRSFDINS